MVIYQPKYVCQGCRILRDHAIVVDGNRIKDILPSSTADRLYRGGTKHVWENTVAVPGTVNVHNHSFQSLLRGIAADRPFLEWRDRSLYHYSPLLAKNDIYIGALLAFGEMLKRGVTTVCDFFYLHNQGLEGDEAVIRAAKDVGIRLVLSRCMYDWEGAPAGYVESLTDAVKNTKYLFEKYRDSDMVGIVPAPHSLHAASPEMIRAGHDLANELGTKYHIHVAEEPFEVEETRKKHNGLTTVEYLDRMGVVDESMVIVHGVWLKDSEIELLGKRRCCLAYCPSSNMFLADGITKIPSMLKAGVRIGLGTDGACSNNKVSVFEEMRMVSLLQKADTHDALCVSYLDALRMGTKNGAEILDLPTGVLEKGYLADFVGIDLADLSMMPLSGNLEQLLPNLVYSMEPTAVSSVVVNGRQVVQGGSLTGIDEKYIGAKVAATMEKLNGQT